MEEKRYNMEFHFTVKHKKDLPPGMYVGGDYCEKYNNNRYIRFDKNVIFLKKDGSISHTMYTTNVKFPLSELENAVEGFMLYLMGCLGDDSEIIRSKVEVPIKSNIDKFQFIEMNDVLDFEFRHYGLEEQELKEKSIYLSFTDKKIYSTARLFGGNRKYHELMLGVHKEKLRSTKILQTHLRSEPKSKMELVLYDSNIQADDEWINGK